MPLPFINGGPNKSRTETISATVFDADFTSLVDFLLGAQVSRDGIVPLRLVNLVLVFTSTSAFSPARLAEWMEWCSTAGDIECNYAVRFDWDKCDVYSVFHDFRGWDSSRRNLKKHHAAIFKAQRELTRELARVSGGHQVLRLVRGDGPDGRLRLRDQWLGLRVRIISEHLEH